MTNSKLTSYQKLKLENVKLKSDIYTLVHDSNSRKADEIRHRESLKKGLVDAVMFGDSDLFEYIEFNKLSKADLMEVDSLKEQLIKKGILSKINNNEEKDIM